MAITGLNSVYGRQEGSGQAYILPQNQAVGVFTNGMDEIRKQQELARVTALKQQQALQTANASAMGDVKLGDHWGARSAELQKGYDDLTNYALGVTQKGGNLNMDREFLKRKNDLVTQAAATKDLQGIYDKLYTEVGKSPDQYENGLEALQAIQGASVADYASGKFKPEELRKRYSLADAIKESNGTVAYVKNNDGTFDTTRVDRPKLIGQAIASLDTPAAQYQIKKAGGDTEGYLAGFPTLNKDGKTYFNTKGKDFEDAVIKTLATDPNFPQHLAKKGYDVSSTESIRKSAFDYAAKQNKATGSYVQQYADTLDSKGNTDTTRVFAAENNQRARSAEGRAIQSHSVAMNKAAKEAFEERPDDIHVNVTTNLATNQTGNKVVNRPSTSFAAANVGNAKSSFLPQLIFDPETGKAKSNAASISISGGQVHIKPVLKFGGAVKIMDDQSFKQLKAGTYKLNGKLVPKNAEVSYDELLYGEERVPASKDGHIDVPASIKKVVIPVTGQSLDGKFDKGYNRVKMWDSAIKAMPDADDKKRAALQVVKQYNKGNGFSDAELKEQAAAYLNSMN